MQRALLKNVFNRFQLTTLAIMIPLIYASRCSRSVGRNNKILSTMAQNHIFF